MHFLRFLLTLVLLAIASPALAASTCSITAFNVNGRKHLALEIVETGARDTTEVACAGVPRIGTILSVEGTLSAGTGTTINTIIGRAPAFVASTQNHIATATTTAAHIHEQGQTPYFAPDGVLYVRSRPNSTATNHTVDTELVIIEGAP